MGLRPDEEYCARVVEEWLVERGRVCSWEPGADPPDLCFEIGGAAWDIEVTGIHRQFVGADGEVLPAPTVSGPLSRMKERLSVLAENRGIKGTAYSAMIDGSLVKLNARELEGLISEYICSGSSSPQILSPSAPHVVIANFPIRSDLPSRFEMCLFLGGLALHSTRESVRGDFRANVGHALFHTLRRKIPVLDAIGGHHWKAILLYSWDILADEELVKELLPDDVLRRSSVDSVILIDHTKRTSAVYDPDGHFAVGS